MKTRPETIEKMDALIKYISIQKYRTVGISEIDEFYKGKFTRYVIDKCIKLQYLRMFYRTKINLLSRPDSVQQFAKENSRIVGIVYLNEESEYVRKFLRVDKIKRLIDNE